ncbi:hypothetical protein B0H14DRAFT_2630354 [Mycena olivaceomarginata]|nr:hypothetical protein B0H14DRAFT_2630354 [Mycena olivaceomarginata]
MQKTLGKVGRLQDSSQVPVPGSSYSYVGNLRNEDPTVKSHHLTDPQQPVHALMRKGLATRHTPSEIDAKQQRAEEDSEELIKNEKVSTHGARVEGGWPVRGGGKRQRQSGDAALIRSQISGSDTGSKSRAVSSGLEHRLKFPETKTSPRFPEGVRASHPLLDLKYKEFTVEMRQNTTGSRDHCKGGEEGCKGLLTTKEHNTVTQNRSVRRTDCSDMDYRHRVCQEFVAGAGQNTGLDIQPFPINLDDSWCFINNPYADASLHIERKQGTSPHVHHIKINALERETKGFNSSHPQNRAYLMQRISQLHHPWQGLSLETPCSSLGGLYVMKSTVLHAQNSLAALSWQSQKLLWHVKKYSAHSEFLGRTIPVEHQSQPSEYESPNSVVKVHINEPTLAHSEVLVLGMSG